MPPTITASAVSQRNSYLKLWREFIILHSSALKNPRHQIAFEKRLPANRDHSHAMNVATVYPVHDPDRHDSGSEDLHPQRASRKDFFGLDEVARIDFLVPLFSEALGTFLLVLIGCASCVTWTIAPTVLHIAFTFGLAVAALAQVLGPVSGCHVNPAVTFGLLTSGNCSLLKAICYIVCQCCGAIAGSAVLKVAIPSTAQANGIGMTRLGANVDAGQGVLMEAIVTFLLVLVVHAVTDPKRTDTKGWAPLAIGLTISVAHLAAVPATGSSMNPARTLGPAVMLGDWANHWVYWVGPLVGAFVAGGLYKTGLGVKSKEDDEASYDF